MRWLAELHTFARPERPESSPPAIGERAPGSFGPAPRLLVFLRHVGCPFAEATVREVELWRRRLPAFPVAIFSQGEASALRDWLEAIGASELPAEAAPRAYDSWGVPVTSAVHFLGPRSLASALRLALGGIRNRHPSGTRWRSAAAFVVDNAGRIAWRHLPAHAGDLPDIAQAMVHLENSMTRAAGGEHKDA